MEKYTYTYKHVHIHHLHVHMYIYTMYICITECHIKQIIMKLCIYYMINYFIKKSILIHLLNEITKQFIQIKTLFCIQVHL